MGNVVQWHFGTVINPGPHDGPWTVMRDVSMLIKVLKVPQEQYF